MTTPVTLSEFHWYLIQTHPKQEDRAESNLNSIGIETLSPKFKEPRRNIYNGTISKLVKPLFPSYIFAKFKVDDLYHKVRYTRGVRQLISFGDSPTVIQEEIIDAIRARVSADGFAVIEPEEDLKPGDRVLIKDGPFKALAGVFEKEMKGSDRVRILLQTVSYRAHVEIEIDQIRKLG